MPNFKIRRKRKKPLPEPQKDEVETPAEITEVETPDDGLTLDEHFDELQLEKEPHFPKKPRETPVYQQERPVRRHNHTTFTGYPSKPVQYNAPYPYRQPVRTPYLGQPRMQTPPNRPQQLKGRRQMRFRSHYGFNGEYYDTQTKARMLLNTCFG